MQIFCYCITKAQEILAARLPPNQTTWLTGEDPQELQAAFRHTFKSDQTQTVVLAVAIDDELDFGLSDLVDKGMFGQYEQSCELDRVEESLLEEEQEREVVALLTGGCYEVAVLQAGKARTNRNVDAASLANILCGLPGEGTYFHAIFPSEQSSRIAVESLQAITPIRAEPSHLTLNKPSETFVPPPPSFESLLPQEPTISMLTKSQTDPSNRQSPTKQEVQEQFDPLVLSKQTLASSKLIAKNREILELKRIITNLQDELLELRRKNHRLNDKLDLVGADSKENGESDNQDVVKKRRRTDDGTDSTRKSVLVPTGKPRTTEDTLRSDTLLSKYRHSMLDLERRYAQLEDQLNLLKYGDVRLN